MLESAKQVLAERIDSMPEEGLLALLEDTFPYVSPLQTEIFVCCEMRLSQALEA